MEAIELRKILDAYDQKLDQTLRLKNTSMDGLNLKKSQNSTKKILRYRIAEVVVFSLMALMIGWNIAENWGKTHLVISGVIVHMVALVALIGSIGQVVLLRQIDYSKPIVEIRKKIELVNSHELLFVKLVFLSAPVWWAYPMVAFDLFLGVDLYAYLESEFVVRYVVVNVLLIVPVLWLFHKLSYKNVDVAWVRKTINFLTGAKTVRAMEFLNDIEEFET